MIENAEEFQGAVQNFESWLPKVSTAVKQFEAIAAEPDEIKKQLDEAQVGKSDIFLHFQFQFLRMHMQNQ